MSEIWDKKTVKQWRDSTKEYGEITGDGEDAEVFIELCDSHETLRKQLTDKERELTEQKKVETLCIEELLEAEEQLAAANAVCEAYDLVVSDFNTTGRCTNLRRENLRNKLAILRKLQGGGGDE